MLSPTETLGKSKILRGKAISHNLKHTRAHSQSSAIDLFLQSRFLFPSSFKGQVCQMLSFPPRSVANLTNSPQASVFDKMGIRLSD